jgi:IclR family acetate operon transcriptional repressor
MRGQATGASEHRTGSQAIGRALDVLGCFLHPQQTELGIADISRQLSLTPSTAHRIVRALTDAGYLEQNTRTDRYHLGRSAVVLGSIAQRTLGLDLVSPVLEEVAAATGESVNYGILDGDGAVIMLRVETMHPLRFAQPVGTRVALPSSAMGKALLAFHTAGEDAVRSLGRLKKHTDFTITSAAALNQELALTRERGYSLDEQEGQLGVRCIGAPVLDDSGHAPAALAVQIPTVRMAREELPKLAPLVIDAATRVAALVGHRALTVAR